MGWARLICTSRRVVLPSPPLAPGCLLCRLMVIVTSIASLLALKTQIQALFLNTKATGFGTCICLSLATGALQASHSISTYCSPADALLTQPSTKNKQNKQTKKQQKINKNLQTQFFRENLKSNLFKIRHQNSFILVKTF